VSPPGIELAFGARWEHWLDTAGDWDGFFAAVTAVNATDLVPALQALGLVGGPDLVAYGRLRTSAQGRAVPLASAYRGTDSEVTLLALRITPVITELIGCEMEVGAKSRPQALTRQTDVRDPPGEAAVTRSTPRGCSASAPFACRAKNVITLSRLQADEFRRTGCKPALSELVGRAIQLLGTSG
jgi:hypothetical protein